MLKPEILDTFLQLLDEAKAAGDPEPTAMNLATVDSAGRVASRIVLLKGADERGFRFFTNYQSDKGSQLEEHPQVALYLPLEAVARGRAGARRRRGAQAAGRGIGCLFCQPAARQPDRRLGFAAVADLA